MAADKLRGRGAIVTGAGSGEINRPVFFASLGSVLVLIAPRYQPGIRQNTTQ